MSSCSCAAPLQETGSDAFKRTASQCAEPATARLVKSFEKHLGVAMTFADADPEELLSRQVVYLEKETPTPNSADQAKSICVVEHCFPPPAAFIDLTTFLDHGQPAALIPTCQAGGGRLSGPIRSLAARTARAVVEAAVSRRSTWISVRSNELGLLSLKVALCGQSVSVTYSASREASRALVREIEGLEAELAASGLDLASFLPMHGSGGILPR